MTARYKIVPLLSPAEESVLYSILAGNTTSKDLEQALHLSSGTVRSHLVKIRHKTGCCNTTAVVLWAWRNGYELP
jgi:DNA-binding CsgD family transcriptional regulator